MSEQSWHSTIYVKKEISSRGKQTAYFDRIREKKTVRRLGIIFLDTSSEVKIPSKQGT